jgi:hypothetical protein
VVVLGIATAAFALLGGTVPSQAGVTYTIPTTHVSDSTPLNIVLGTYPNPMSPAPTIAVFSGSIATRSTTGEGHVHCNLTIGSPARIIGSADQAGVDASLPSTGYPESTLTITGTYTAAQGEQLKLSCTTTGITDALLVNGHAVINKVASEAH